MSHHLDTTPEKGQRFFQQFHDKGKVVMLNLLRFREIADYTGLEQLAPEESLSGREAYQLYMKYTQPHIEKIGSRVLFYGNAKDFLIGPEEEKWDMILLVEHPSAAQFIAFAQDEGYLSTAGHRKAALADSRLLPISQLGT